MHHTRIPAAALLTIAGVVACSSPATGQSGRAGQVEFGTFGTLTRYDATAQGLDSRLGSGGWLGWYPSRLLSVEAVGDYTATEQTTTGFGVDVTRLGGTLVAHTRATPFGSLYLGAGYERRYYRGAVSAEDDGARLVLGDRFGIGGRAALRIEGRVGYFPGSALSATDESAVDFGAAIGLSIFTFGGPPRDNDGDGVANRRDHCPDTPRGATVDADGCPADDDADGVVDGLDRCPDTPSGAGVDAGGCPSDADGDQVFDGIDACPNTPAGALVDAVGCPVDSDEDGVFDGLDQCSDTPRGAVVDAAGCAADADGDGVANGLDRCPNTPRGAAVDEAGCPTDDDGDGVPNARDQCPATPAGVEVDDRGCPIERDSDNDGVPDGRDRCPNTAPGQNVDAVGCPILFVIEEGRARPLVLRGVNFETGKSALTTASYAALDEVAASLLAHPDVRIEIAGHTDNTGPRALNMRLSLQRAQAVKAYLARKGVEPSRMEANGYGPDQPIATNTTADGRAQNRRVELHLLEDSPRP